MSVVRTVARNVTASWVGLGSQLLITFFLTPFVIDKLGIDAYGVWLLLQSAVGYYGLIDMGLRSGLTQSITRRIATKDTDGVRRHLAVAIPTLSLLGLGTLIVALVLAFILPRTVEMGEESKSVLWLVILIQALSVGIQMPLAPYSAVLVGLQRHDIANGISILTRLISAVFAYLVLSSGGGLLGLSLALLVSNVLDSLIRCRVAQVMLPEIVGIKYQFVRSELGEITSSGAWNFVISVSRQLIYFSDSLVIGLLLSASAIAPFGIASSLIEHANRFLVISVKVLFPTFAHLRADSDRHSLRLLYFTATKIMLGASLTVVTIGTLWVSPFLAMWLGRSADKQIVHEQAPLIFLVLGIGCTFFNLRQPGLQLLLAENKLKTLAGLLVFEAACNLVLSISLAWWLGLVGVAIGTALPAAFMALAFHLPMHASVLEVSYAELLRRSVVRPIVFWILLLPGVYSVPMFVHGDSWTGLILAGAISVAIAGACSFVLLSREQLAWTRGKGSQLSLGCARKARSIAERFCGT